jgi:hypothetical protein
LHVAGLVHVYSCTRQPTTGLPPYFLMFGRTPRSPVEITFGLEVEGKKEPSTKYVETMKERLKKAYELASRSPRTAQERQNTRMSLLGWLTIPYGSSSHLSAILCFASKATILSSTLSPGCRMARRTFLSHPDFWRSCAVLGDLDARSRSRSII